jgi:DNA-binding NarL/FixJ family response regulator
VHGGVVPPVDLVSAVAAATIVSALLARRRSDDALAVLTPRELEVLTLMAGGSSNQGIAERLFVTLGAVEKYVSSIFAKLGLPATRGESRRVHARRAAVPAQLTASWTRPGNQAESSGLGCAAPW